LGLIATPSVGPSVDTTEFLNSCVYTLSENDITLEFNHDSMCTGGSDPYLWPDDFI
jgi:hypothetical protein